MRYTKEQPPMTLSEISKLAAHAKDELATIEEKLPVCDVHLARLTDIVRFHEADVKTAQEFLLKLKAGIDPEEAFCERVNTTDLAEEMTLALQAAFVDAWKRVFGENSDIGWRFSVMDKERQLEAARQAVKDAYAIKQGLIARKAEINYKIKRAAAQLAAMLKAEA